MKDMAEKILPVLHEAGAAILEVYEDVRLFNTEYKEDRSPLTEADKRSNKVICDALEALYPEIPIISEENKQDPYQVRSAYDKYFLIDPLDGTKEFIKRNGEFTINVAYLEGGNPIAGFVHVPLQHTTYYGIRNHGAWKVQGGKTETIFSNSFYLNEEGLKVVASRSHRDPRTDKIISLLSNPQIVSVGSALKFIMLATGQAHFYPRLAPTMEWDTAAAQCIVEESGGSVIRFDNLLPVTYNKPDLGSPYFIATGKLLDPESLIELLKKL